ncbi:hypothetical protein MRX96_047615 [Rhipicephalus microplus]
MQSANPFLYVVQIGTFLRLIPAGHEEAGKPTTAWTANPGRDKARHVQHAPVGLDGRPYKLDPLGSATYCADAIFSAPLDEMDDLMDDLTDASEELSRSKRHYPPEYGGEGRGGRSGWRQRGGGERHGSYRKGHHGCRRPPEQADEGPGEGNGEGAYGTARARTYGETR